MAKLAIPAGKAAAMASAEYQDKNIRSKNNKMLQAPVLKINGTAMVSTSL